MKYFPITMIIVLSASLFAALLFLPVLGGLFGKTEVKDAGAFSDMAEGSGANLEDLSGLTGRYIRMLKTSFKYPFLSILACAFVLVSIILTYSYSSVGLKYFPDIPVNEGSVLVRARGNMSLQEATALTNRVENIVLDIEGIKSTVTQINPDLGYASNSGDDRIPIDVVGQIFFELEDYRQRDRNSFQLLDYIRQETADIPGIIIEVSENQEGPPVGKDVQLQIRAPEIETLTYAVEQARQFFDQQPDLLTDIEDNRPLPGVEWVIDVDREKAGRFATNVSSVGSMVQMITNGTKLGTYRPFDAEEEMDIRIRYP